MNAPLPRILVLGSGAGSNFEALAEAADGRYDIIAVGSDKVDAKILERAERRGIRHFTVVPGDYPDRRAHDGALAAAIEASQPDWIALAGYMRLVGPETLAAAPSRILNIHPALLPAFTGLDTHRRALEAGVREHGSTVHFVTPELDAGPGILQARLIVKADDTPETLETRVKTMEHTIYPQALGWCAAGRVAMHEDQAWFDGQPLDRPITVDEHDT